MRDSSDELESSTCFSAACMYSVGNLLYDTSLTRLIYIYVCLYILVHPERLTSKAKPARAEGRNIKGDRIKARLCEKVRALCVRDTLVFIGVRTPISRVLTPSWICTMLYSESSSFPVLDSLRETRVLSSSSFSCTSLSLSLTLTCEYPINLLTSDETSYATWFLKRALHLQLPNLVLLV